MYGETREVNAKPVGTPTEASRELERSFGAARLAVGLWVAVIFPILRLGVALALVAGGRRPGPVSHVTRHVSAALGPQGNGAGTVRCYALRQHGLRHTDTHPCMASSTVM